MILTLILMLTAPVEDDPWVEVSRDGRMTHYVDRLSIRAEGERRFLRHRVDYATVQPNGAVTATYEVEISCEARTIALVSGADRDQAGEIVQSHAYRQPTPRKIDPGSVADNFFEIACGRDLATAPADPIRV